MGRLCAALLGFAACLGLAEPAWAGAAGATLRVERSPGAEVCPSDAELSTQIEAVTGDKVFSGAGEKKVGVTVTITPDKKGFVATITLSGSRRGERVLSDRGPGCEVLGQALAVTVAVLLEQEEPVSPPDPNPKPDPDPPLPEKPKPPPTFRPRYFLLPAIDAPGSTPLPKDDRIPPLALSVGGFYDSGTLAGDTGGLLLSADFFVPIVSVGVGFLWLPEDTLDLPNHTVRYSFLGGSARACTRAPLVDQFGASVCLGLVGGGRSARLDLDERRSLLEQGGFLEAQSQLELSRRIVGPFGVFANLGLGIPFLVDPIALELPSSQRIPTPEGAVTFQLGVGIRFWVEPPLPSAKKQPSR